MRAVGVAGVLLAVAVSPGCRSGHASSSADKAGGSKVPIVLRLADSDSIDQPGGRSVQDFAARVAKLSGGALRVRITYQASGNQVPNVEALTVRKVRSGQSDLGWTGARVWDELGVKSFQALQAPFLITGYVLLDKVAASPLAAEMLAGLNGQDVVGLALVPDLLRHPIGLGRSVRSLDDFAGLRIRIQPSKATRALMIALGAVPVETSNFVVVGARAHRVVDAEELALANAPGGATVTANLTFFGKTFTLFGGRHSLDGLTASQQRVLRTAAEQTLHDVVSQPPSEREFARQFCHIGRVVLASNRQLEELRRATGPVYAQLQRDPLTRSLIARIRRLKAATPGEPPVVVPRSCSRSRPYGPGPLARGDRSPGILNGTYRWALTAADARAFGRPASDPGNTYPVINTVVLRDGIWLFGQEGQVDRGTYSVTGDTIAFDWPRVGSLLRFAFRRAGNGTLHLKPVLPMEKGDQFVWSGAPWRRVGPPLRSIPSP